MGKLLKMYHGSDAEFTRACDKAGVQPTHRQWRKWVRGYGSARKAAKGGK